MMVKNEIRSLFFAAALASTLMLPGSSIAQDQPAKSDPPKKEEPKKEEKKDPKVEDYERAIKDLKKYEGTFTVYLRRKDILLEIPESKLGKLFCAQLTLGTGVGPLAQAGDPIADQFLSIHTFRLEKRDEQVWLISPPKLRRWSKDNPLAQASERTFPEAILAGYRIEQTHPEKKLLLVNITNFFYGDVFRLNEFLMEGLGGMYTPDREKSSVGHVKQFKDNSIVRMNLHYTSQRSPLLEGLALPPGMMGFALPNHLEDPRSIPFQLNFNIWFRKDEGYVPRFYDPRVGYFTTGYFNVDKVGWLDATERFITRWNFKKKDPKAKLSEPVKPFVWTLDTSIPQKYRKAVRDGILRWNKAFEKIGLKDAIRVQDAPTKDPDYDHADGRYNVIRWVMTDFPVYGAVAQPRWDPLTGEILSASVSVDASNVEAINDYFERAVRFIPSAKTREQAMNVLTRQDTHDIHAVNEMWESVYSTPHVFKKKMEHYGWDRNGCSHALELSQNAAYALHALEAFGNKSKISKEAFLHEFLADLVSHEIGHCLGLRHNFAGSTYLTEAELASPLISKQKNISASVMEYLPINAFALIQGDGLFFHNAIGVYDEWAVRYGYAETSAARPQDEKSNVQAIARDCNLPGHAYMTDEDADFFDPYAVRSDQTTNPLAYIQAEIEVGKKIRRYAIQNLPRPGESYDLRTKLILGSMMRTFRQGFMATRFVGGIKNNRNLKNDLKQRPTIQPVDPELQRRAVQLVARECLSPGNFELSPDVLKTLSFDPEEFTPNLWFAPVRIILSDNQMRLVATLLSASATDRITENHYKTVGEKGAYSIAEHYATILGAVFADINKGQPVSALRRDLHRFVIEALIAQASAPNGAISDDVRMLASDSLRRLDGRVNGVLKDSKKLDALTSAHLRDMGSRVKHYLNHQVTVPATPSRR